MVFFFFFSSRRRHTRYWRDWSSDVCSSDLSRLSWHSHSCVPAAAGLCAFPSHGNISLGPIFTFPFSNLHYTLYSLLAVRLSFWLHKFFSFNSATFFLTVTVAVP